MALNVLILGGTAEGRLLAERLAPDPRFHTLLSYAGRTERLQRPSTPHRIGGFGGSAGLAAFLRSGRYDAVVDATHPFAARISANAVQAAQHTSTPLVRLVRPLWRPQVGDVWIEVASMEDAAAALGAEPRTVFLTVGKQEAHVFARAPQHAYVVRSVDDFDPGLPRARLITARGPFTRHAEVATMRALGIDVIVTKNAGTDATYAKIEAARELALPVVVVTRPKLPAALELTTLDEVQRWLEQAHSGSRSERGV